MTRPRVGIIGGGICGPVMAMLLKLKGYDPVVYERSSAVKDSGLGIGSVKAIISYTTTQIGRAHV